MKNLAEQLEALKRAEEQAWEIYSKSVTTQVNRILDHMGLEKNFSMDDVANINRDNQDHDFATPTISDKTLAYAVVNRYSWVKVCREKWNKAFKKYFDFKKEIEEASKALK